MPNSNNELILSDLVRRVGLLEININGSGDSIARLIQDIKRDVADSKLSREIVNDLENRVLLLEERTRPCQETQKLKELASFLVKLPGGLWGPVYCLITLNVAIALAVDLMGPAKMMKSFLGL